MSVSEPRSPSVVGSRCEFALVSPAPNVDGPACLRVGGRALRRPFPRLRCRRPPRASGSQGTPWARSKRNIVRGTPHYSPSGLYCCSPQLRWRLDARARSPLYMKYMHFARARASAVTYEVLCQQVIVYQTFSTGFSSGAREGGKIGVMLSGTSSLLVRVPSGPVDEQNGMGALGDVARDFLEVGLHHVGVGVRQCEGRPDAARAGQIAPNG
jgi:hypothetical protein